MRVTLNQIGQIGLGVTDFDRAESFYADSLGLRKLYRFGDLLFFDCAGLRLFLEKLADPSQAAAGSPIYFCCAGIALAVRISKAAPLSS